MRDGVTPDARHLRAIRPNPVHAADLVGLFLFNEGGGGAVRDRVGLIGHGALSSATQWVRGLHGGALRHNRGLGSALHFPGSVKAGPFTALWRGTFRAGPGSHYWAGEWHHNYIGGNNASWGFNVGTGGVVAFRASNRQLVSTTPIPIGRPLTVIGCHDGARVDLYVHAGAGVEGLGNTTSGFVTDSRYTLRIGGYWGGNTSAGTEDVDTDLFVLWRRKLGPQEAMALVRAPERIFADAPRRVYGIPGAGPAPSIAVASGRHDHAAATAEAGQEHRLAAAAAMHAHGAAAVVVQEHRLAAAAMGHVHDAAAAAVVQEHRPIAAGVTHAHGATAATFTQGHEIGPLAALHHHGAAGAGVTAGGLLLARDMAHGQAADSPDIAQMHGIAPEITGHPHLAGAPLILGGEIALPPERRVTVERDGRALRPGPEPRVFFGK